MDDLDLLLYLLMVIATFVWVEFTSKFTLMLLLATIGANAAKIIGGFVDDFTSRWR